MLLVSKVVGVGEMLRLSVTVLSQPFAAGNTTASVMGRTYPGAGGTIGPALTFGFLAAEAASTDVAVPNPVLARAAS